jgi:hypothetical protein
MLFEYKNEILQRIAECRIYNGESEYIYNHSKTYCPSRLSTTIRIQDLHILKRAGSSLSIR